MSEQIDVHVQSEGSLFLFVLETQAAHLWAEENLPLDATRWGGAIVVEPRFACNVATGMAADGLVVR